MSRAEKSHRMMVAIRPILQWVRCSRRVLPLALVVSIGCGRAESTNLSPTVTNDPQRLEEIKRQTEEHDRAMKDAERRLFEKMSKSR